jgi:hypothetical protein
VLVRNRGALSYPYSFVDSAAEVLSELTIDVAIDLRTGLIRVDHRSSRALLGVWRRRSEHCCSEEQNEQSDCAAVRSKVH